MPKLFSPAADTAKNAAIAEHAALVLAMSPKVATFAPGSQVVDGLVKAVDIKGHTAGHSGYLISSGESLLLYIGDALHHHVVSTQRPRWPNGFDSDKATAAASREAPLVRSSESGQRLYALHFPFPGIGKIEKHGNGFAWAPQ